MISNDDLQRLYQYSFSLTANSSAAEDLLQSAIEKYLSKPTDSDKPLAYFRAIIRNQFIDQCRRQQRVAFEPLEPNAPALLDPQNLETITLQRDLISKVFDQLGAAEREVLYLWAVMGYSASEIASDTGQSRNTILSRLHRIRKKAQTLTDSPSILPIERPSL